MIELELLGPSADGQSVVFTDAGGNRYEVLIDDKLRTVVRRDPNTQDSPALPELTKPRPADIQSLLRQGRGAHEIAEAYGLNVEDVRRYESPVAAEKAWAINQAQRSPVGMDPSTPRLEELVINRLATRGVEQSSLQWNAQKHPGKDWEVSVSFIQSAVERVATWRLSSGGGLEAIDQEAHWLTESATPAQSVNAIFGDVSPLHPQVEEPDDAEETEALLDQLNSQRGKRQPIMDFLDGTEDDVLADAVDSTSSLPYFSARMASAPNRASVRSERSEADTTPIAFPNAESDKSAASEPPTDLAIDASDDTSDSEPLFDVPTKPAVRPARKKGKRTSVPSWDEIVFGARGE